MADETKTARERLKDRMAPFVTIGEAASYLNDHSVLPSGEFWNLEQAKAMVTQDPEEFIVWRTRRKLLGKR